MSNYKIINPKDLKNYKQYLWFSTFSNPTYSFNVKLDVSKLVEYTKETKTSFFINMLYIVTKSLNSIDEFKLRIVNKEIRLYENINPSFIVRTISDIFENVVFDYVDTYKEFYNIAHNIIEDVKTHTSVKESFNDSNLFNEYYITCAPWISLEGMTHPVTCDNLESSSCPRILWDKYRCEFGKIVMLLNITVNHAFVDGKALSDSFNLIQENIYNCKDFLK
jgi:chloramphenicol O-acetyltransferase type A